MLGRPSQQHGSGRHALLSHRRALRRPGRRPEHRQGHRNYQATECGAREFGGETQDQTGTVVRAHHEHTDFVLLELDAKPPAAANVYFAGWSWAAEAPSSSFSIHQGVPSPKAISIDNDPAEIKPYLAVLDWDAFEPDPNELYLGVEQFEQGSVEPGSSGGALFDQDKRVVGQLRGAQTGCTSRGPAMSGRLAKSWSIGSEWDGSLRHWLDPLGTGETAIDGRNGNHPPTASGTLDDKSLRPSDNGQAGRLTAELSYGFLDPDRDDLTYAVSSSDASKVTAAVNGSSVALEAVAAGSATITVTATDAGNLSTTQTFTATVDDNRSPEASQAIARLTLDVDDGARSVDISDVFADADSDALTYGASSSDASVATVELVQLGAQTTVTVTPQSNGSARVLVTATDAAGSNTSATRSFEVVVNNRAPVLILPTLTMRSRERRKLRFSDIVSDPDGDLLRYGVTEIHDGPLTARRDGDGVSLWTRDRGAHTFTVTATDVLGSNTRTSHAVTVTVVNDTPRLVNPLPDLSLSAGEVSTINLFYAVEDNDDSQLDWTVSSSNGAVATVALKPPSSSGFIDYADVTAIFPGTATITVTGVDDDGALVTDTFEVTVAPPAPAPGESLSPLFLQVENGAQSVDVSSAFTDPTNLTFTAASSDATVATVAVTGSMVTVTPVLHGTTTVTVTGTDGGGSPTTQTFTVTVANRSPQAAGTLPALSLRAEDGAGTVDVSGAFTDPDNDALTFTAASSDATVARAAAAGSVVTVTPLAGGTTTVTVTATDGSGSSATQEFDATVANRSPAAAGTLAALSLRAEDGDRTVDVSGAFTDPDNDDLTYVATSSDETVATVAVADSVVTVTPLSRGTTTVTVTATDVENGSATQTFEVTVANRPPELVGRLAALSLRVEDGDETVDVSGAFTDPDNDDLTFAARSSNETAATVAVSDSVVTVTPLSGGTTRVTVTATDEENRSATQEFEVTVVNRPPLPADPLADAALQVGEGAEVVEVADAFRGSGWGHADVRRLVVGAGGGGCGRFGLTGHVDAAGPRESDDHGDGDRCDRLEHAGVPAVRRAGEGAARGDRVDGRADGHRGFDRDLHGGPRLRADRGCRGDGGGAGERGCDGRSRGADVHDGRLELSEDGGRGGGGGPGFECRSRGHDHSPGERQRLRFGFGVVGAGDDRGDGHVDAVGHVGRGLGKQHLDLLRGDVEQAEHFGDHGGLRHLQWSRVR